LNGRELLRRVDTKFLTTTAQLSELAAGLDQHYAVLPVTNGFARYRSLYFDTPDLQCFHDHRRGRRIRHKVRVRHYVDRSLSFFEIKTKRNELITEKTRLDLPCGQETLGARERALADQRGLAGAGLAPVMWIEYRRLTMLGLATSERVTIDIDLALVAIDGARYSMGNLAIVEAKQWPFCMTTPIMRAASGMGLRERSMSKYVVGLATLQPDIRRNRLLPDLARLNLLRLAS
jgi:hypothetical protein